MMYTFVSRQHLVHSKRHMQILNNVGNERNGGGGRSANNNINNYKNRHFDNERKKKKEEKSTSESIARVLTIECVYLCILFDSIQFHDYIHYIQFFLSYFYFFSFSSSFSSCFHRFSYIVMHFHVVQSIQNH